MVTKREHDARMRQSHNPKPMSIDQALASENPIGLIWLGLGGAESLSKSEQIFWQAAYFLGDTLNAGLDQTLTNSTGDLFYAVRSFVKDYCDVALFELFDRIAAVFPDGLVPSRDLSLAFCMKTTVKKRIRKNALFGTLNPGASFKLF